jgi:hypothetical protein
MLAKTQQPTKREKPMTDTTDTTSAPPAIRARNKHVLFAALAEAGIHRVTIEYDGSGDSGQIDTIEAWDAGNDRMPLPPEPRIEFVPESPGSPSAEYNLEPAIETVAWDYLYDLHCGWENNDGAYGTFVFDVPARTLRLEHNERYTEVSTTTHEF